MSLAVRTKRSFAKMLLPCLTVLCVSSLGWSVPVAAAQPAGYWHASGSEILDANGKQVRVAGINWYGFETTDEVVHGLNNKDYKTVLSTIHTLGYNTVRLPYSNQMVEDPIVPSSIGYNGPGGAINSDLKGLNSLQIMDKIIAEAGQLGLKVILDNHRSEAGNSTEANGLWYTSSYPETSWIADWKTLAARYASYADASGNPTVIGVDLRNEPHFYNGSNNGACWTGDSSANDCPTTNTAENWPAAAARAANAVLAINSKLLIFVEGVDCYSGDCDFWGGNLEGVKNHPVTINVAQRLVYSAHDYGPTEYQQSWFNGSTTDQSLDAVWTKFWAYVSIDGIAPVWVGEFGTTNDAASAESSTPGSEGQWFSGLVSFLANQPNISWTYWALNGEDNYGLLDANYDATPPSSLKQQLLSSIQFKFGSGPSCGAAPGVPASLAAKSLSSSSIGLSWGAVTPPANCSVTYSVYRGTASAFAPSSSNQVTSGLASPSYTDSGLASSTTYYYAVEAVDADGSSAASAKAGAATPAPPVCGAVPAAPSGLKALATSASAISLSWTGVSAPTNCSVTYSVFRSTASSFTPGASDQIASGLTTVNYGDSGLSANTTYYYAIEAVDTKGASAASAKANATTAKAAITSCAITYTILNQWNTGFQAGLAITNTGSAQINSWTLTFSFPGNQQVASLWNANYSQSGEALTLTNEAYNGAIAPGATSSSVGFTGTYSGTNAAPAKFYLNGSACALE